MSAPSTPDRNISRRAILLGGAAAAGLTAWGAPALAHAAATPGAGIGGRIPDPFTLGVASGDPRSDSAVLWTRLAPDPLADDGLGGMPGRLFPVQWQVSENERFTRIVAAGVELARPELAHSVHVEPSWLRPGREYFYRFRTQGHVSPVGRTRTAPAHGSSSDLTMCFASCSHFGEGYFTAYRRLAEDHPDLILHLGDYQYEYPTKAADVRTVLGPETRTLAGYRQRHAQYKTDPDLQLAHATAPWLLAWDDHEIENNWADEVPEQPDPEFLDRRAAAFKAYYENMPLRSTARPHGIDMRLYRRFAWGDLATFHMLDTRQYRDDQACGDGTKVNCAERLDPNRTITGAEQERWLLDGFHRSRARWDVLGQQVFFAQRDLRVGPDQGFSMDAWDGYRANRDRIAAALGNSRVRNGVVLTGDVHRHWAAEVKENPDQPDSRGVGVELVATSITSGGDGGDDTNAGVLAENPHLKFYKNRRGYVRTRFTAHELRAEFRILPLEDHIPGLLASDGAELVAICDEDPDVVREQQYKLRVAGYTDFAELFRDEQVDLVVVCVPHHVGRSVIEAATDHGVHILKEKPFATTLTEATELAGRCEKAKVHLMVTLQRRFNPIYTCFTQLADQIGTPFVVDAAYTLHITDPSEGWRGRTAEAGGGCVIDMGYHLIDMLLWYFGLPDRVLADMSMSARPDRNYDAEDTALIHFSYDSGLYGSLLLSRFIGPKTEQIRLVGSHGIVHLERGRIRRLTNDGEVVESLAREQAWPSAAASQINYFCRVIEGLRPNMSGPRENVAHLSFIAGCYESARTRTYVNPKDLL